MRRIDRRRHNRELQLRQGLHKQHALSPPPKHTDQTTAQRRPHNRFRVEPIRPIARNLSW